MSVGVIQSVVGFCDSQSCTGKVMTGGGGRNTTVRQNNQCPGGICNKHVSEFLTIPDTEIYAACFNLYFLTVFSFKKPL